MPSKNCLLAFLAIVSLLSGCSCSEKTKILVFPFMAESHFLKAIDLIEELSLQPDFNVSVMLIQSEKYKQPLERLNVNLIYLPGITDQMQAKYMQEAIDPSTNDPTAIFSYFLEFTKADPTFVPFIKEQKFDVFIREIFLSFNTLAHIFDIPHNIAYLLANVDTSTLHLVLSAPIHSTYESSFRNFIWPSKVGLDEQYDYKSFWARVYNVAVTTPIELLAKWKLCRSTREFLAPEYQRYVCQSPKIDILLNLNVEGALDKVSVPPNVKSVYPLGKVQRPPRKISSELQSFLDKHNKIILATFGIAHQPPQERVKIVADFAAAQKDYQFIVAVKKSWLTPETLKALESQPNIFLQDEVPQEALLNSGKISVFFSHGGYSSIYEALEGQVPLIASPSTRGDQINFCQRVHRNEYGYCLMEPTVELLQKALKKVEGNEVIQNKLAHISKVIQLKKEDNEDSLFWIRYILEIGGNHFINKDTRNMNYFALTDMDIHFAMWLVIVIVLLVILKIIVTLWKCLTCKYFKNKVEPKSKRD